MLINKLDNVEVNITDGHKYAVCDIKAGENVIKYGQPIGHAISDIKKGEHVHSHNLKTNLSGKIEYSYDGYEYKEPKKSGKTFMGYVRENGDVGIRNDIWIVNTVGCVNKTAQILSEKTGAKYFPHPFGCSQLGEDQEVTRLILKGLINHPNAGGVLVLGLGCENSNIEVLKGVLGEWNDKRVKFLNAQDEADEIEKGIELIEELKAYASGFERKAVNISELRIGLKCGGSDGYSGITANPLVGRFCDKLTDSGGMCVLTEVPEMFGAEHLLMKRCKNKEVFEKRWI